MQVFVKNISKNLLLGMFILIQYRVIYAQQYNFNVIYQDTILKGKILGSTGYCYNRVEISDSLINYVSGLKLSFQITGIKDTGLIKIYNAKTSNYYGVLKVGDTLPIGNYNFGFFSANIFDYALIVSGKPNLVNESYYCKIEMREVGGMYYDNPNCFGFHDVDIRPEYYVKKCTVGNFSTVIDTHKNDKSKLVIVPNPSSSSVISLFIDSRNQFIYQIRVYDLSGKVIQIYTEFHNSIESIDIKDIQKGMYFIEAITSEGSSVSKFIKAD